MTWIPPEVAQSTESSTPSNGWVPPEVKKKEPVSFGGSESVGLPSAATEDNAVSDGAQLSFSEQQQTKTPDFMGLMADGYKDRPSGVMKSVSEGLSKAEKPLEDKYAAYVDKKRTELTGGLNLPNPMEAVDPNQYQQDLDNYTRVLRENPMAEKEDNKITAIGMLINQTKDADRVIEDYSQQNVAERVGSGIKKGVEDYGRGYFELFDRLKQNQAVKELNVKLGDLDKGKDVTLDEGDRLLAQSLVENGNKIKQLESLSPSAYNIGKMAGESLGFTGEFLLTGGLGAGLAKSITKGVATKIAEGAAVSAAKRIGVGLSAKMAQTGIQVAAMPTFYKGIAEDVSRGENFGESLFKNYYKTFADNFTERIFLKTPWDKATVGSVDKLFGRLGVNMHTEKGVVGILASTAEEAAEEKIGEIMTAPLNNDNFKEFWKDYWDVKKNGELLGSVALMTVPMGLVSYSAKKYDDVKLDRIGKLLPNGVRGELDHVLSDKKLTLKEQYDLVGKIVEDNAANKTLGDNLGESASNVIRYVQQKTKSNVVSAVEDRAKAPTIGTKEEITPNDQAKLDYLESNNIKVPDGTTMEQLNVLYDETKQKEEPTAPVVSEAKPEVVEQKQEPVVVDEPTAEHVVGLKEKTIKAGLSGLAKQVELAKDEDRFLRDIITDTDVRHKNRKAAQPLVKDLLITEIDAIKPSQKIEKETVDFWKEKIEKGERPFVIVRENNAIDGQHKLQAYRELGIDQIPVLKETDLKEFYKEQKSTEIKPNEATVEPVEPQTKQKGVVVPSETKVAEKQQKEVVVYHSTYADFKDFKEGVNYFAEDPSYSKEIATTMNGNGKASGFVESRELKTIPAKINSDRIYELPKGEEMNSNLVDKLIGDPEFVAKYDAIKGVDLYSKDKVVYAVLDKSKIEIQQQKQPIVGEQQIDSSQLNLKENGNKEKTSGEKTDAQENGRQDVLTDDEVKQTSKSTGISPKNLRDVYKAGREVFGLNKVQSLAQAIITDRVVGAIAKKTGKTKQQIYSEIEYRKADELLKQKAGIYFQAAWHGSPYQFDKFTTEKIGTGEGAQAFGWGLYFTDLKGIAEGYAEKLSEQGTANYTLDGKALPEVLAPYLYDSRTKKKDLITDIDNAIKSNKSLLPNSKGFPQYDRLKAENEGLLKAKSFLLGSKSEIQFEPSRNLYKVELHKGKTTEQYDWLVWDKKLTNEQIDKISGQDKYLAENLKNWNENGIVPASAKSNELNGSNLYRYLESYLGSDKEASILLLKAGIDGIKYPAESIARGATSDNARGFNYVVFDENAVTIEEVIKFQNAWQKNRGAMLINDGKAIVYALTDPNVSTPVHELAHVYERYMTQSEKADVLKWTGDKTWTVATSEKFARGFENYLATGVAPTKKLQAVFERFKAWLTDIYNGIKQSEIDVVLNSDMKRLYDSMLTGKPYVPSKEKVAEKATDEAKKTYKDVDDLLFQEGEVKFQDTDRTERHTKALENLISHLEAEKAKDVAKEVNDYLKAKGNPISQELVDKVLKEKGYASQVRKENKGNVGTQKGVVEGAQGKLPVGNDVKDQKTPRGKDEIKQKTSKLSSNGKDVIKVGRFETRLTLDETKLPESVKEQIKERGIGEFVSMRDEQSYAIARQIASANTIEEITQMSLSPDVHPMVRVGLMLEANKIFNKEVNLAEKEGRTADAQKWSDQQIDYYEEYAQINSRNAALLLRGLGTAAALETFAPFTHVVKYKRDTAAERQKLQSTDTHKKSVKRVQKVAKTAYKEAVDGAINDPKVQKIIKENEGKPTSPVKPDRLAELKKKEKSLIEKLKKSFGGTLTSGGLTKEGIEALGELAVVYIEEAGYHVGNAVKKLIKTAKAVGFVLTEKEALDYMPKKIDGKPIKEKQAEEETAKAAEKLANKIFGEVVATKQKEDPLLLMVNTLLGKFKERDLGKERKKPATDIERIANAIQNKETYSEVWKEARDLAISKIEENELLDDIQKEEAIKRVEDAYQKATNFTFTEAQVDRAIKRKMAELGVRVSDVVREFYDIQSAERGKLSDALIAEAGLGKEQARVLAEAIERRFDTMLSDGKKKILEKYIGKIREGNTPAEKTQSKQRKTKAAELLELVNIGAFDSPEFREAYATAIGIPEFSQENAVIIRKLGEEIQRQKEPLQKHKKIQDLLGFIKLLGGISPTDMALSIWYANTLSGIKTQERNIIGGTSGVTLRLLSDALVSGRPMATARGYINGITAGWTKAMDAWKDGYAPFSSRVEIPSTAEVYQMKRGLFKPIWNSIKYVGRTMNALDLLNAETGKEAFATVLANEALKVNRWKALTDPKYAKEQRELVRKYLVTDKETVARLKQEIEDDAAEFGYSELDKRMILLDKINRLRPTETAEQTARFGVYSTGNVESFGTVGFLSDKIGDALKGVKLTYSEPRTGKQKTIAPLSLFAAFTKIAGNVGEMSLNYVPSVGMYRVYRGAYGSGFRIEAGKEASPNSKYAVELTPREKQTIIGQQILGTVAMVGLYLMTQPDDEGKSKVRITANGTGDFKANKNLTDWQEYSIGVTNDEGKTTWISYKNTPLILPFSVLGFMRDSKQYKKEYREVDDLDLFTKGIQGMPSFLGDMSAIGSMTKVFDNLINVGSGKSTQSIPDNLLNTVKNFYTPAIYRDVVDLTEQMWDVNVEAKIKGTSFFDLEAKKRQMFGRNPISVIKRIINKQEVVEAIDVYGRPTERLMPLDIIIKRDSDPTEVDKLALYHQKYANVPVEPNVSQTLFEAYDPKSQEYVRIPLDQGDKRQQVLWHNFIRRRGELILQAISDNMDLKDEEYRDAIEPAIRDASQQARLEIEEELAVNPLKDIEERQLKKK
ncbi:MAG: hypothetical protein ACYC5G_01210 [Candidatus Doudnabacteria bacterium]